MAGILFFFFTELRRGCYVRRGLSFSFLKRNDNSNINNTKYCTAVQIIFHVAKNACRCCRRFFLFLMYFNIIQTFLLISLIDNMTVVLEMDIWKVLTLGH